MSTLTIVLLTYLLVLVFYTLYIAAVNIYYDWDKLARWVQIMAFPPLVLMILLDMAMNITLFTLVFVDPPREYLVTQRLMRYRNNANGWRTSIATTICTQALNPFDPTRKHC